LTMRDPQTLPIEKVAVSVSVPVAMPPLRLRRRLRCVPAGMAHKTLVSDVHKLASPPLIPVRRSAVAENVPRLLPKIVSISEPVSPWLEARSRLKAFESIEMAQLELDCSSPEVKTTSRVRVVPWPMPTSNEVSDTQKLASQAVAKARDLEDSLVRPIPDPCNVTKADPDEPEFSRYITLGSPNAIDRVSVALPPVDPRVKEVRRVPEEPPPIRHRTVLSDCTQCSHSSSEPIVQPTTAPSAQSLPRSELHL